MRPGDVSLVAVSTYLANDSWFGSLPEEHKGALLSAAQQHEFLDGGHVYRIGDPPNGLHAVVHGHVRLISYPVAGQEQWNMIVKRGRWFGELSVIDGGERPHDALAAAGTIILSVAMAAIVAAAERAPLLWRGLALLHCAHHRLGMRDAARVRSLPALARLAAFLAGHASGTAVEATQDDLARLVGVSRQRINMLLGELGSRGVVRRQYGRVKILDPVALSAIADPD